MQWLITGGCGFIGTNLVLRLVERGEGIRVFDNLSAVGVPDALVPLLRQSGGPVDLVEADIRDADAMSRAAEGMDVAVHLAACTGVIPSVQDPRTDCETNVLGTLNLLEAARTRGLSALVMASSGAPLGEHDPPLHEDLPARPVSPYGASKLAGEAYCSAYHGSFGLRAVALRFSNVYGPHSAHKESVVARFIKRALRGEGLVIFGDGSQTRDYLHVDDLLGAVERAARDGRGGQVYQVATGVETPLSRLVELLLAALEAQGVPRVPVVHEGFRPGEVKQNYADATKARRELGWAAALPLEQGIPGLVRWYLDLLGHPRP